MAEFAAYGIAGARVDRIAKAAKCSAGLVYTYFGSKEELFDAVFELIVVSTVTQRPIDVDNLPEYAGQLFDGYAHYPDVARLVTWYRLEHGDRPAMNISLDSITEKADAIEQAQKEGKISSFFAPLDLLALILHMADFWASITPEFALLVEDNSRDHRRKLVVDAVTALLAR